MDDTPYPPPGDGTQYGDDDFDVNSWTLELNGINLGQNLLLNGYNAYDNSHPVAASDFVTVTIDRHPRQRSRAAGGAEIRSLTALVYDSTGVPQSNGFEIPNTLIDHTTPLNADALAHRARCPSRVRERLAAGGRGGRLICGASTPPPRCPTLLCASISSLCPSPGNVPRRTRLAEHCTFLLPRPNHLPPAFALRNEPASVLSIPMKTILALLSIAFRRCRALRPGRAASGYDHDPDYPANQAPPGAANRAFPNRRLTLPRGTSRPPVPP